MDQLDPTTEDAWRDLGASLRQFEGTPDGADGYGAFLRYRTGRRRRGWLLALLSSLGVVALTMFFSLDNAPAPARTGDSFPVQEAAAPPNTTDMGADAGAGESSKNSQGGRAARAAVTGRFTSTAGPVPPAVGTALRRPAATGPASTTPRREGGAVASPVPGAAPPVAPAATSAPEKARRSLATDFLPVTQLPCRVEPSTVAGRNERVVTPPVAVSAPLRLAARQPDIVFGGGLSNHWRGNRFMADVDRGVYAYIGLRQRVWRGLHVKGRVGYRGHSPNIPLLNDVSDPWSYNKKEVHSTAPDGSVHQYIYEGTVRSYRAVEFDLLAAYQITPRLELEAGFRYALPSVDIKYVIHGPDDANPFHDFIQETREATHYDYGFLGGLSYRLSPHLSVHTRAHLGQVDLISDVAEDRTRVNHSSSVSFGVQYWLR